MINLKAIAQSKFHQSIRVVFTELQVGTNYKKLKGPRSNYCLDYNNSNNHVCGCGFPISQTDWKLPDGFILRQPPIEVGNPKGENTDYGRGWIKIDIVAI